jgi:hypothetical protein
MTGLFCTIGRCVYLLLEIRQSSQGMALKRVVFMGVQEGSGPRPSGLRRLEIILWACRKVAVRVRVVFDASRYYSERTGR